MTASTTPTTVVVACAADHRYGRPLAVALASALSNLDPQHALTAFVVDGGLADEDRRLVASVLDSSRATLRWLAPDRGAFEGLPLWGRMPIATYDRLALPALLPDSVTKLIWLDADVLVIGDLARLWDASLTGHHVLAVPDDLVPRVSSPFGVAGWRTLGLDAASPYFNAGVLVADLAAWRRDNVAGKVLAYLKRERDAVCFWDQEGLNAVLAGRWGRLDARWNRKAGARAAEDAWVLHFSGNLKPWLFQGKTAAHALYYRYLDRTPLAGWRPAPSLLRTAVATYDASPLRVLLHPVERLAMRAWCATSRRLVTSDEAGRAPTPERHG